MRERFDRESMADVRCHQRRTDELTPTAWGEGHAEGGRCYDSGQMRPLPDQAVVEAFAKGRLLLDGEHDAGPASGTSQVRSQARRTDVVVDDGRGAERR